ncbi:hypothetical protein TNCV_3374571 [Trichonephila clavipes]|nr:hypothetical protein TNCV_3374571 [Trichonephila clavipes]
MLDSDLTMGHKTFPTMRELTKNPSREQVISTTNPLDPSKAQISLYPHTCTQMYHHDPKQQELWKAIKKLWLPVDPIPKHLEKSKPLPSFVYSPDMTFWQYTSTGLACLLTRPTRSAAMPRRMVVIYSNALNSMNAFPH